MVRDKRTILDSKTSMKDIRLDVRECKKDTEEKEADIMESLTVYFSW